MKEARPSRRSSLARLRVASGRYQNLNYSVDLNTGLVWYSKGSNLYDSKMLRILEGLTNHVTMQKLGKRVLISDKKKLLKTRLVSS